MKLYVIRTGHSPEVTELEVRVTNANFLPLQDLESKYRFRTALNYRERVPLPGNSGVGRVSTSKFYGTDLDEVLSYALQKLVQAVEVAEKELKQAQEEQLAFVQFLNRMGERVDAENQ